MAMMRRIEEMALKEFLKAHEGEIAKGDSHAMRRVFKLVVGRDASGRVEK